MNEWYPIATAPRDGSRIRVRGLNWGSEGAGYWSYDAEFRDGEFWDVTTSAEPQYHFNPDEADMVDQYNVQWTYIRIAQPEQT